MLHFGPELEFKRTGQTKADVLAATQQCNDVLESWIRRYPDQWLWIHRRWKTRPAGEPDSTANVGDQHRHGARMTLSELIEQAGRQTGAGRSGVDGGWRKPGGARQPVRCGVRRQLGHGFEGPCEQSRRGCAGSWRCGLLSARQVHCRVRQSAALVCPGGQIAYPGGALDGGASKGGGDAGCHSGCRRCGGSLRGR